MLADHLYLLMPLYQVLRVLVFALFLAATLVAARRTRAMVGAAFGINLPRCEQASGMSMRQLNPLLAGQQGSVVLVSLCFAVGSVLLRLLTPQKPGCP